jgi:hypothetical protein
MIDFLKLFLHILVSPFKTQARLEAEIVLLRHQLNVLRQRFPSKPRLSAADRLLFVWLYRLFPSALNAITIVQPETIIRWHRTGFRLYWRWKSRSRGGRTKVPMEIRRLIREMSLANRLWGAPRIHGELLKLGIEVGQSTVAKYMARSGRGRSQSLSARIRFMPSVPVVMILRFSGKIMALISMSCTSAASIGSNTIRCGHRRGWRRSRIDFATWPQRPLAITTLMIGNPDHVPESRTRFSPNQAARLTYDQKDAPDDQGICWRTIELATGALRVDTGARS